ncbi:hypothetical protein [Azospirillum sp. sgz302134]
MALDEGLAIKQGLEAAGYRIFPMISDSFANRGEFLRLFRNTHHRDFREGLSGTPTGTMERGHMWTSGAPLLDDDWRDLLELGVENGFGSVTLTFHGLLDADGCLLPHGAYPIGGVFPGERCEEVIQRLHAFNRDLAANAIPRLAALPEEARRPLEINVSVTVGRHNHGRGALLRYAQYFNRLGVTTVRFNRFHDHGGRHPHLVLSEEEVVQAYRDFRWLHDHEPLSFQLAIDEDFGSLGIEVMEFPPHVGWCRAGRQLFAVVPDPPELAAEDAERRVEWIGSIGACVDAFHPLVGRLVRDTDKIRGAVSYRLDFRHDVIADLNRKRMDGTYRNGCYALEMETEMEAEMEAGKAAVGAVPSVAD